MLGVAFEMQAYDLVFNVKLLGCRFSAGLGQKAPVHVTDVFNCDLAIYYKAYCIYLK